MACDPETRRVLIQTREFGEGDFPPGLRGAGWPQRELDVPTEEVDAILAGGLSGKQLDRLHRAWWDEAGDEEDPLWPEL
jgi:hypothetical protein